MAGVRLMKMIFWVADRAAPSALSRNLAKAIAKFEPATPFRKPISLSSTFGMVPDLTTALPISA